MHGPDGIFAGKTSPVHVPADVTIRIGHFQQFEKCQCSCKCISDPLFKFGRPIFAGCSARIAVSFTVLPPVMPGGADCPRVVLF